MIIGADATRRRRHPADQRARSTAAIACGASTIRPSARSPIRRSACRSIKPPLMREHRLYQADWLMRFYGFCAARDLAGSADGMLDLEIDPEARLGAAATAALSRSTSTAPTARRCCGCRASASKVVERIVGDAPPSPAAARGRRPALPVDAKVRPFIVAEGWSPGGLTDQPAPARAGCARPRAAEPVLMQDARPTRRRIVGSPRDRFRRLARRRAARCALAGVDRPARSRGMDRRTTPGATCLASGQHLPRAGAECAQPGTVPRAFVERAETVICHSRSRALRPALPHALAAADGAAT